MEVPSWVLLHTSPFVKEPVIGCLGSDNTIRGGPDETYLGKSFESRSKLSARFP